MINTMAIVIIITSVSQQLYKNFPEISERGHENEEIEYEGYDGWYNNRAHPEWGAVGKLLDILESSKCKVRF